MKLDSDSQEFWRRVEHDMKIANPTATLMYALLLKTGIFLTLFTAGYLIVMNILTPAKGYLITSAETALHPFFWGVLGVIFIIIGAIMRYRAMGPIMEKLKNEHY